MKNLKKTAVLAFAVSTASLSTGCFSVTGFDSPAAPRPVERTISVAVETRAGDGAEPSFVRDVAAAANRNLARRGFRLAENGDSDVKVSFDVSQKEFNRAGDFIVYDGRVDGRVSLSSGDARTVDQTSFSARGERALGAAAATDKLSAAIVPQVEDWVEKTVTAENLGLAVLAFSVDYHGVKASRKAALVDEFVKSANATEGVHDCQLVGESWKPGRWSDDYTATYRIVYDAGAFPNGPLNTISVRNPDLEMTVLPAAAPAAR